MSYFGKSVVAKILNAQSTLFFESSVGSRDNVFSHAITGFQQGDRLTSHIQNFDTFLSPQFLTRIVILGREQKN